MQGVLSKIKKISSVGVTCLQLAVMPTGKRAADQTVLGVTMTKDLKSRIFAAAEREKRSMANFCAFHLEKVVDLLDDAERQEKEGLGNEEEPILRVATDPTVYRAQRKR
jgi:hypothetical protein